MFNTTRTPVTVFKSTDPGAPVLSSAEGALKTVLKACLVTGYGTKTALGWEALSESDFEITFRSRHEKATKCCLVVDNKTQKAQARVSAFVTHADAVANNGSVGRFGSYKFSYTSSDRVENKWWLIGHGRAFIFIAAGYNTPSTRFIYFGDFATAAAGDNYNCAFLCSHDSSYDAIQGSTTSPFAGVVGEYYSFFAKSYDGLSIAARAGTLSMCKQSVNSIKGVYPNVISGGFSASEIYLVEASGSNSGGGIRGILGGVFWSYDSMVSVADGTDFANVDNSNDVWSKFKLDDDLVGSSTNDLYSCLVNATAWEI